MKDSYSLQVLVFCKLLVYNGIKFLRYDSAHETSQQKAYTLSYMTSRANQQQQQTSPAHKSSFSSPIVNPPMPNQSTPYSSYLKSATSPHQSPITRKNYTANNLDESDGGPQSEIEDGPSFKEAMKAFQSRNKGSSSAVETILNNSTSSMTSSQQRIEKSYQMSSSNRSYRLEES